MSDVDRTKGLAQYSESFGRMGEAAVILEPSGSVAWVNDAFADLCAREGESMCGLPLPIRDGPFVGEMLEAIRRGQAWSGPWEIERDEGPLRVQIDLRPAGDGRFFGFTCDQQEQREREEQLRRRAEEYRIQHEIDTVVQSARTMDDLLGRVCAAMVEMAELEVQAKAGVFLIDSEGLRLAVTHGQFCDDFKEAEARIPMGACLCGRVAASGELLVSQNCFNDPRHEFHYQGMTAHGHFILPLKAGGRTLGVLFLYTDPNLSWDEDRLSLLRAIGGTVGLAIQRLRDEEALRGLTVDLRTARDQALEAAGAKSQFLANMSHELRTPLNAVIGMTDLLLSSELSDEQLELVLTAQTSGKALLGVLNDILDFSKIEAGRLDLERVSFSPRLCLEEVGDITRQRAAEKGIELAIIVDANVPVRVLGDPVRLRQVLLNLVGNAVKFTHEGEVVVRVSMLTDVSGEGVARLHFSVSDTGIGIAPEAFQHIFSSFSQQDSTITRRFGGTGLGLAISKQIVERMGGELEVQSVLDEGSSFSFEAEFSSLGEEQLAEVPGCVHRDISGTRVLVVDSSRAHRRVIREQLRVLGCEALEASDGAGGLEMLEDIAAAGDPAVDMIFVDGGLEDISSVRFAARLKADARWREIPLLSLTPAQRATDSELTRRSGFTAFLVKPVKRCALCAAVARARGDDRAAPLTAADIDELAAGRRILVVEDNLINQKVTGRMLDKLGYAFDVAADGVEAVEAIARRNYDVVLMDCQMPLLDGFEATRRIRRLEEEGGRERVPIVALTAGAMEDERNRCLEVGMDQFLGKPIQLVQLDGVLRRFCGQKQVSP